MGDGGSIQNPAVRLGRFRIHPEEHLRLKAVNAWARRIQHGFKAGAEAKSLRLGLCMDLNGGAVKEREDL